MPTPVGAIMAKLSPARSLLAQLLWALQGLLPVLDSKYSSNSLYSLSRLQSQWRPRSLPRALRALATASSPPLLGGLGRQASQGRPLASLSSPMGPPQLGQRPL